MKLSLDEIDKTGEVASADDMTAFDFATKIPVARPVIKASGRAFVAASGYTRRDLATSVLNNTKIGRSVLERAGRGEPLNLTPEETKHLEALGYGVNILTGTTTSKARGLARLLNAPSFLRAMFGTVFHAPVLNALAKGDMPAAAAFTKEYGRAYLMIATLTMLAELFLLDEDEDLEYDPRSSKFMVVPTKFGYGVPLLGPAGSVIRFLARAATGQKKLSDGEIVNLRKSWLNFGFASEAQKAKGVGYKQGQVADLMNFGRGKLHAGINSAVSVAIGENFFGNEENRAKLAAESFVPITPLAGLEAAEAKGPAAAAFVSALEFAGVNTRPDFTDPDIQRQAAGSEEKFKEQAGGRMHRAAGPSASSSDRTRMKEFVDKMKASGTTNAELLKMLEDEQKTQGSTKTSKNGKKTAYGRRIQRFQRMITRSDTEKGAAIRDAGNAIFKATEESSSDEDKEAAKLAMKELTRLERYAALKNALKRQGMKTDFIVSPTSNKTTAYGERRKKLRKLMK